jgi:hypothetical protein
MDLILEQVVATLSYLLNNHLIVITTVIQSQMNMVTVSEKKVARTC